MKAVLVREFAPLDQLSLAEVPAPTPGPGEVLIAVHAAGVNFMDGLIAQGKYQTRPPLPFSPGAEVAGTVKALGAGVTGMSPGMRVLAATGHGGFAEQVIMPAAGVMALPEGMDFAAAASFPIVYGTSHHALKERAQLRAGETLLVLGAAGGVGLTAVELGKVMGARVIACASSDEKLALCKAYGADELINYSSADLRERIRQLTAGKGVDVVYDPVGGALGGAVRSQSRVHGALSRHRLCERGDPEDPAQPAAAEDRLPGRGLLGRVRQGASAAKRRQLRGTVLLVRAGAAEAARLAELPARRLCAGARCGDEPPRQG